MIRKDVLTTFEAARLCSVSYNTIKNWIKRGLLEAYRTAGGHLRIKSSDLEVFCRRHSIPMEKGDELAMRKVLIAEGDSSVRELLRDTLRRYPEKLEVHTVGSCFEAGLVMSAIRPDLFVFSPAPHGMEVDAVCQLIRKQPYLKHSKIVMLSQADMGDNKVTVQENSLDAHLPKPIDSSVFLETVSPLLHKAKGVRGGRKRKTAKKK